MQLSLHFCRTRLIFKPLGWVRAFFSDQSFSHSEWNLIPLSVPTGHFLLLWFPVSFAPSHSQSFWSPSWYVLKGSHSQICFYSLKVTFSDFYSFFFLFEKIKYTIFIWLSALGVSFDRVISQQTSRSRMLKFNRGSFSECMEKSQADRLKLERRTFLKAAAVFGCKLTVLSLSTPCLHTRSGFLSLNTKSWKKKYNNSRWKQRFMLSKNSNNNNNLISERKSKSYRTHLHHFLENYAQLLSG